jgi:hypothetical protein
MHHAERLRPTSYMESTGEIAVVHYRPPLALHPSALVMDSRSPWLMIEKSVQSRKARNLSDTTSKRQRYTSKFGAELS